MPFKQTHTFVVLEIPQEAYDFIAAKLSEAGYGHAFHKQDGQTCIDMQGIALAPPTTSPPPHAPAGTCKCVVCGQFTTGMEANQRMVYTGRCARCGGTLTQI